MPSRGWLLLVLVLLAAAGVRLWKTRTPAVAAERPEVALVPADAPRGGVPPAQPVPAVPPSPVAGPSPAPGKSAAPSVPPAAPPQAALAPDEVAALDATIDNIKLTLRNYRAALGGNPIGNNREITGALLGDNLKQLKLPLPEGSTVNADGELCDRWGTPYFFHQLSKEQMEIRSAGPDKTMWTADDRQL